MLAMPREHFPRQADELLDRGRLGQETAELWNRPTHNDRQRVEELGKYITDHEFSGSCSFNYNLGTIKVNVNFEDEHSREVRKDYHNNCMNFKLKDIVDELRSLNWNHFTFEERAKLLEAAELVADVAASFRPQARYVGCGCGENEACSECRDEDFIGVVPTDD